jgi:hypothetical protein
VETCENSKKCQKSSFSVAGQLNSRRREAMLRFYRKELTDGSEDVEYCFNVEISAVLTDEEMANLMQILTTGLLHVRYPGSQHMKIKMLLRSVRV